MEKPVRRQILLSTAGLALTSGCLGDENAEGVDNPPRMSFGWEHHLDGSGIIRIWHDQGESVQADLLRFTGDIKETRQTWADLSDISPGEVIEEGSEVELTPVSDSVTVEIKWYGDSDNPITLSSRSIIID